MVPLTVQAASIPCELGPSWAAPVGGVGAQLVHLPVACVIHNPATQKPSPSQLLQGRERARTQFVAMGANTMRFAKVLSLFATQPGSVTDAKKILLIYSN